MQRDYTPQRFCSSLDLVPCFCLFVLFEEKTFLCPAHSVGDFQLEIILTLLKYLEVSEKYY